MNTNERLRWGMIGCGAIGSRQARFLERMPGVSLVTAVNLDSAAPASMPPRVGLVSYQDFRQHRYDTACLQAQQMLQDSALGIMSWGDAQVKWDRTAHYYQRNGRWRGS